MVNSASLNQGFPAAGMFSIDWFIDLERVAWGVENIPGVQVPADAMLWINFIEHKIKNFWFLDEIVVKFYWA